MGTLSWIQLLQLCSFSIFMAAGQFLFKMAALNAPPMTNVTAVAGLALNPWLWGAMILYAVSTVIWISVLQSVPLSIAYPFVALGFIVVPCISYFAFKEPLNWQYGVGIVLILIALKLITGSTVQK